MHLRIVQQRRWRFLSWWDLAQELCISFQEGIDGLGHLTGYAPNHPRLADVRLICYSEYTAFPTRVLALTGV